MGVTWLELARQIVGGGLRRLANDLLPNGPSGRTMEGALRRIGARADVRTVIDVGASNGRWSIMARRYFPHARFLLVEAQARSHEASLRRLRARWPEVEYVLAAAGPRQGTVRFDASDPLGGIAAPDAAGPGVEEVPVTTLDAEVSRLGLGGPYLVKLDTHGYEVPILEGATGVLREAAIVVIEAYNFDLSATTRRFAQMTLLLEEKGFGCVDLVDVLHRPRDGALWQMDLVFARRRQPDAPSFT